MFVLAVLGVIATAVFLHFYGERTNDYDSTMPQSISINHDGTVIAYADSYTINFFQRQNLEDSFDGAGSEFMVNQSSYMWGRYTFSLSPTGHNLLVEEYDNHGGHNDETKEAFLYHVGLSDPAHGQVNQDIKWQLDTEGYSPFAWLETPPLRRKEPDHSHHGEHGRGQDMHELLLARCTSGNLLTCYALNEGQTESPLLAYPMGKISNNRILNIAATRFDWGDPDGHGPNWAFVFLDDMGKISVCEMAQYYENRTLKGSVRCVAEIDSGLKINREPEGPYYLALDYSRSGIPLRMALVHGGRFSSKSTVKVWEIKSPTEIKLSININHEWYDDYKNAHFTADGNLVVLTDYKYSVMDVTTGNYINDLTQTLNYNHTPLGPIVSGNGQHIMSGDYGDVSMIFKNSNHSLEISEANPSEKDSTSKRRDWISLNANIRKHSHMGNTPHEGTILTKAGAFAYYQFQPYDADHKENGQ